jgi:hypothetical protein
VSKSSKASEQKPRKCPFCGAPPASRPHLDFGYWRYQCKSCKAWGPRGQNPEEAAALWDQRSGPIPEPGEAKAEEQAPKTEEQLLRNGEPRHRPGDWVCQVCGFRNCSLLADCAECGAKPGDHSGDGNKMAPTCGECEEFRKPQCYPRAEADKACADFKRRTNHA